MRERKTGYRSSVNKVRKTTSAMPKWKAWLLIGFMMCLTGLLLWYGLAIVVRCERVHESRVDVTVHRSFCGLIPISSTTLSDVVEADVFYVWARTSGGGRETRGFTERLELQPREGPILRRNRFGPSLGTRPELMAPQINQFIKESSESSIKIWWMPWLVNLAAIPFVLLLGGIIGEVLWRALGHKP